MPGELSGNAHLSQTRRWLQPMLVTASAGRCREATVSWGHTLRVMRARFESEFRRVILSDFELHILFEWQVWNDDFTFASSFPSHSDQQQYDGLPTPVTTTRQVEPSTARETAIDASGSRSYQSGRSSEKHMDLPGPLAYSPTSLLKQHSRASLDRKLRDQGLI